MKVLILGGSGILSLDVLKESQKRHYEVTCITRGTRDYRLPKGVNIVHGDIHSLESVLPLLDEKYDAVLDFLSFDVRELKYKLDNLSSKCEQYFFVSSSVAYSFDDEVITEETRLGNDYWDYGANKVKCENYLRSKYKQYGIKYTIIRPYITYGKTRIPFGIIPVTGEYWSLANRIINHKPILMWDDGQARCTLTNTEDFARGYVDLIGNEKAFNQAYHITSGEVLTWMKVLDYVGKELNEKPIVFSAPTSSIVKLLPEYKGVLEGDKARDRIFDNTKIKDAAPSFSNLKPFSVGISETIKNYLEYPIERTVDYEWDGRIDWAITKLAKSLGVTVDKKSLKYRHAESGKSLRSYLLYLCGRYLILGDIKKISIKILHIPRKVKSLFTKVIKKIFRKKMSVYEIDKERFHSLGNNCEFGNCEFGLDTRMISIGSHVHIGDGTLFINYRSSAEWFDSILSDGSHNSLRDLGPIIIEDNVYISKNVTIYPNVTIGKNSLVLEGTVLTESVPENSVVQGNPGIIIDTIENWYNKLLETNQKYPWYEKTMDHDSIVREREEFFFEV